MKSSSHRRSLVALVALSVGACASTSPGSGTPEATPRVIELPAARASRTLASYARPAENQQCYDREAEPYTAVVDAHFHPRPFGGAAIEPTDLYDYFERLGVRFVNYFGIGQVLELDSGCTYYLDCPGVTAMPSVKNDFVNGMETVAYPHDNLHVTLSMTFMDLAHPEDAVERIREYDREYPGMFKWAGELNVIKQALVPNNHEPASLASIDRWAPFMNVLRDRGIPVTLHSDLGNDENPTEFLYLMDHVLETYPDNKIVWAHMGLSKELTSMEPARHVALMKERLDAYPNLMLDISWDVLYNAYHQWGDVFIPFFDEYFDRILPGSDFVAAANKDFGRYAHELEITSRALRVLDDRAFRHIALGENYFRFLGLDGYHAPQICGS